MPHTSYRNIYLAKYGDFIVLLSLLIIYKTLDIYNKFIYFSGDLIIYG